MWIRFFTSHTIHVKFWIVHVNWHASFCVSNVKNLQKRCPKIQWMEFSRRINLYCIVGITVYYIIIHFIFIFPPTANMLVEREKACGSWLCGGNSPVSTGRHWGNPVHTFCKARSARAGLTGISRWHLQPRWEATGWSQQFFTTGRGWLYLAGVPGALSPGRAAGGGQEGPVARGAWTRHVCVCCFLRPWHGFSPAPPPSLSSSCVWVPVPAAPRSALLPQIVSRNNFRFHLYTQQGVPGTIKIRSAY